MIRPYKGVQHLLQAFPTVASRCPHAHLVIAGKPWVDWTPYQRQIEEGHLEERVHLFLEYIPEARVPLFFSAADLVVLPYIHFDAQSGVGAWALPHRKPMIVSDVGGLPEWVANDPHWIVPAGDAQALAERIIAFLSDPDGATAAFRPIAEAVLAESNWDRVAKLHLEVYAAALQSRPKP